MPRVNHVKRARKQNAVAIPGESYYWWMDHGEKRYSLSEPPRSLVTASPLKAAIYALQESMLERTPGAGGQVGAAMKVKEDLGDILEVARNQGRMLESLKRMDSYAYRELCEQADTLNKALGKVHQLLSDDRMVDDRLTLEVWDDVTAIVDEAAGDEPWG